MASKRAAIIHFLPLELYPPAMNDITSFGNSLNGYTLSVYSTNPTINIKKFRLANEKVKIKRFGIANDRDNSMIRYINYFLFYFQTTLALVVNRPGKILYFETLSSLPVYIYKVILKLKGQVFIHYHEYTSSREYKEGMKLNRWFHQKEKLLYPIVEWVSHTNAERMKRFVYDIKPFTLQHTYILPNYPPANFYTPTKPQINYPVKIVYVGALSMTTMYTQEFAKWVVNQNGKVTWDIYSWNITDDVKHFLKNLGTDNISVKNAIHYYELKNVLTAYDVGVILYKGHNENYIFNAPNKLFEYHICGLDVWVSDLIKGSLSYITDKTYPKIIAIDFLSLNDVDLSQFIDRAGYTPLQNKFFCDQALLPLQEKFLN